ncbi:hypothetical protein QQS21_000256 [Conoideocrella luteorostrata]|uniref:GH16 domain-containing protein n=1 Tax=Conoideocrella luteorostrata TaxID=1105319 RepID=A0AAJ0CZL9_9HYPO|nr:hypothetical protein QQS21_000256 [Conoideocrella luteorostrata]
MQGPSAFIQLFSLAAVLCPPVAAEKFHISKTYDAKNFFDSFTFATTGGVTTQNDDNWSWVQYQNRDNAIKKGLAAIKDNEVYLGIDHTTRLETSAVGRDSLRLVSRDTFKYGLLIARFTHLPKVVCGGWPAYWTLGEGEWPIAGEMDLYEGWNLNVANKPALHTGPAELVGNCTLDQADQTAGVIAGNCDNKFADYKTQWPGQGCQSEEKSNTVWGSPKGGIRESILFLNNSQKYSSNRITEALEWTRDYIKIFTWADGQEPSNLGGDAIDTSSWGKPSIHVKKSRCDIDKAFLQQRILFTLPVCGNPPGNDQFWKELDGGSGKTCDKVTGEPTCKDYVAKNPQDFKDFYFQIKDVRLFKSDDSQVSSSASISTSSSTRTSSSVSTSFSASSTAMISRNSSVSTTSTISRNSSAATTSMISRNSSALAFSASTVNSTSRSTSVSTTSAPIILSTPTMFRNSSIQTAPSHKTVGIVQDQPVGGDRSSSSNIVTSLAPAAVVSQAVNQGLTSTIYTTIIRTITSCPLRQQTCAPDQLTTFESTMTAALSTTVIYPSAKSPEANVVAPAQTVSVTVTKTVGSTTTVFVDKAAGSTQAAILTITKTVPVAETVTVTTTLGRNDVQTVTVC